jgi:phosphate starvation-inducible PhoH-like protein
VFEQLKNVHEQHGNVDTAEVERALAVQTAPVNGKAATVELPPIEVFNASRKVQPKTHGQARYMRSILDHDVVIAAGPAGTGKTYLAVAMAVAALKQEKVRKIVLVRPAVEAGESLGYLPGDMHAKINPYLRPLLDALREMLDYELLKRLSEQDVIEVVPLAYMRGRTLNEAFIILDEAQNTTIAQMKMFLTRMGRNSKIVVSGDMTRVDLPSHTQSGLSDAMRRLGGIEGISLVTLSGADIVRHRLVQDIVRAYEEGAGSKRKAHS